MLVLVPLFLVLQTCSGRLIQPASVGAGAEGDPAPGRSPGPPEETGDEDHPTMVLTSEGANVGCSFRGGIEVDKGKLLNVTLVHPLFKSELLVAGVTYEGKEVRL